MSGAVEPAVGTVPGAGEKNSSEGTTIRENAMSDFTETVPEEDGKAKVLLGDGDTVDIIDEVAWLE